MNPLSPSSVAGSAAPAEAYANRVIHAARQFEAVLLNSLLGSLEHSFSALPGKKTDSIPGQLPFHGHAGAGYDSGGQGRNRYR